MFILYEGDEEEPVWMFPRLLGLFFLFGGPTLNGGHYLYVADRCRPIRHGLCCAFWDGPMSPQAWRGSLIGDSQPVKKGELGKKAGASFCLLESRPRLGGP